MAEQAAEAGNDAANGSEKKGLPIKMILIVLVLLFGEAGGLVALMAIMGGPPKVQAVELDSEVDPGRHEVEVPVLHEQFMNSTDGRTWFWDVELLVVVREKHRAEVEQVLLEQEGAIRTGVGRIIAAAKHEYFHEPGRTTLTNQLLDYFRNEIVPVENAEEEERVLAVLIPKCMGFPADY